MPQRAEFQGNFPTAHVQCAAVEDSDFFGRTFDGVVAWGLFFLLGAEAQRQLITKVAAICQAEAGYYSQLQVKTALGLMP